MKNKNMRCFFASLFVLAVLFFTTGSCNNPSSEQASTPKDSTASGNDGFVQIFDGKTFTGWSGDTTVWRIDSGSFIGEITPQKHLKANTFLIWRGDKPADFEFKAEYRISPDGNSGINYRSEELKDIPLALKGYQLDIDGANQYTGQNYEERGRGFLAYRGQKVRLEANTKPVITDSLGNMDSLKTLIKNNDWNSLYLVVKGNRMKHYINNVLMSDVTDNDTINRKFDGWLGLQAHVLPHMKVEYRNIWYKKD
jgi:hypothetical protein